MKINRVKKSRLVPAKRPTKKNPADDLSIHYLGPHSYYAGVDADNPPAGAGEKLRKSLHMEAARLKRAAADAFASRSSGDDNSKRTADQLRKEAREHERKAGRLARR